MKALITGASSGIGEAYATKCAELGYDLIITGRREDLLRTISARLSRTYHVSVEHFVVELSDDAQLEKLVNKIMQTRDLHMLINNAGFGTVSYFMNEEYTVQEKMVKVHILAPMKLIYAALPGMIERKEGILINVSSISAKTPLPTSVIYSASKSFLQIFSESLYLEVKDFNIMVQTLCPGFTRTSFHERIGMDDILRKNRSFLKWMSPEKVVEISFRNLKKGKVLCIPGLWNKLIWVFTGILPRRVYYKIVSAAVKQEEKAKLSKPLGEFAKLKGPSKTGQPFG